MNRVRNLLLLATAAMVALPAAALAQDQGREHREGGRPDGGRQGGGQPGGGDQPRGPQGGNPPGQAQAPQQPQAQAPRPEQQQRFQGRPDRPGGPGAPGGQPRFDGGRPNRGPGDFRPAPPQQQQPGFREGGRPQGFNGRPDQRGFDRPGPDRPGFDRGPGANGGPGPLRPDWRNDRRYDWRGFRDQHRDVFRAPRYVPPRGYGFGYRRFGIGVRLQPFFFAPDYWIGNPGTYDLPPAYGPYRWVRYYSDVLLVDIRTGEIVDEIPDFFW